MTERQREGDGTRIRAKRDALGHPRMGIPADNARPVVDGDVVQDLVNDVGHRVILTLRIAPRDETEFIHEGHEFRRIGLGFLVPYRGGVTAGLIGAVEDRGNGGRGHRFQFLHRHRPGGILRADDIHFHRRVGSRV